MLTQPALRGKSNWLSLSHHYGGQNVLNTVSPLLLHKGEPWSRLSSCCYVKNALDFNYYGMIKTATFCTILRFLKLDKELLAFDLMQKSETNSPG